MIDVSFAIVNHNRRAILEECLKAIFENAGSIRFEILVVDNASSDGSVEMVREQFPSVEVIVNEQNRGRAAATNQAIRESKGRYVFVLDNDAVVLPDTLQEMVRFMDEHPRVGVLGCRLLKPDGGLEPSCRALPTLRTLLFRALHLDRLLPGNRVTGAAVMSYWGHDSVCEVEVVAGACMLVRREVVEQVGLMDEQFVFYAEEADWCYRIKQGGWEIYFTPNAEIIHYGGLCSGGRTSVQMHLELYRSSLKYFKKHNGWFGHMAARLLSTIRVTLRLLYWSFIWLLQPSKRQQASYKIGLYWPALRWLLGVSSLQRSKER